MHSFNALYQSVPGGEHQEVSLMLLDRYIQVGFTGTVNRFRWDLSDVRPETSSDGSQTVLRHAHLSGSITVPGRFAFDRVRALQQQEQLPWFQKPRAKEWLRNGMLVLGFLLLVAVAYMLVVPWASEKLAGTVSVQTERQLGDGAYDALATNFSVDSVRTRLVGSFFDSMHVSSPYTIRIAVVNSDELNAFALPGGRIVVYSALLDKMEASSELAALLSHEFTHVDRRHATRSIFRKLGSQVFFGLLLGKVGSVAGVLADHADELRSLTYSRSLEKEADLSGLKLLTDRGIDPEGFTGLFERLRSEGGASMPEFMASHPDLDNRVAYIKDSSKGVRVRPQPVLDAIFAQLKKP